MRCVVQVSDERRDSDADIADKEHRCTDNVQQLSVDKLFDVCIVCHDLVVNINLHWILVYLYIDQ